MNLRFLIVLLLLATSISTLIGAASAWGQTAPPPCDPGAESDSGRRMKCRVERMNDAFGGIVDTALDEDTGLFTETQKRQLRNLRSRARREGERTAPQDFKQVGRDRDVECLVQEILGDVRPEDDGNGGELNGQCDGDEVCIGDEDGYCNGDEMDAGGCAEVIGDGIGDDDGICEAEQGGREQFAEACVEICETDAILAESDCTIFTDRRSCNREPLCKWKKDNQTNQEFCQEKNLSRGKAFDSEDSAIDATAVLTEANTELVRLVEARRLALADPTCNDDMCSGLFDETSCEDLSSCGWDADSMVCSQTACDRLRCLMQQNRSYNASAIEGVVAGAAAARVFVEPFRDATDDDIPVFPAGGFDGAIAALAPGLIASGLDITASWLEVVDDSETADRLDATGACLHELGGEIEEVKALTQQVIEILLLPHGQRPGFPLRK